MTQADSASFIQLLPLHSGCQVDLASGSVQAATLPLRTSNKENACHRAGGSRNKRVLADTH